MCLKGGRLRLLARGPSRPRRPPNILAGPCSPDLGCQGRFATLFPSLEKAHEHAAGAGRHERHVDAGAVRRYTVRV
jgi:hypothetical protein